MSNPMYNFFMNIDKNVLKIKSKNTEILNYVDNFNNILDDAVYGHKNAKKQIECILGQWINGETSGYCFGFEGPPGIGKTSLAKILVKSVLESQYLYINASDENGIDTIRTKVTNFSKVKSFDGSLKVIILDFP